MKLVYEFQVKIEVLSDRLNGVFGVIPDQATCEEEKGRAEKVMSNAILKSLGGGEKVGDLLVYRMTVMPVSGRVVLEDGSGGGLGRLTEETKEGQKRVKEEGALEGLCAIVDKTLSHMATVSVTRNYHVTAGPAVWIVKVDEPPVAIEVRHPDLLVALGMAVSALQTEGV